MAAKRFIPMLDLRAQAESLGEPLKRAVAQVLESGEYILGDTVKGFEDRMTSYCGAPYAVGMSSGTDALLASLMAFDMGPGDEVIAPAFSFFATASVVARLGARVRFADIDPESFNVSPESIEAQIGDATRAIVPVHLFGRCADMTSIVALAGSGKIKVIEDAAQAIGACDADGLPAGTIGDLGCFSFYPTKNLGAAGDGGLVVTGSAELAERLRALRVHGAPQNQYVHEDLGGNFRMDAVQAAVLVVKLAHLDDWTRARREKAALYRELIETAGLVDPNVVRCPREPFPEDTDQDGSPHVYHQFVLRVERRDALRKALLDSGIASGIYYPVPLHLQPCFGELGYERGDFPNAERASEEVLALPIYPELSEEAQRYVVAEIARFYGI